MLKLDNFDYYLNTRFEYDGVWEWGGNKAARLRQGGINHRAKYFGQVQEAYPGQFSRHAEFEYESSRRRIKEALWQLRLFEAYVNLTKGPLFLRIGRQNLSWGERDHLPNPDHLLWDLGGVGFPAPVPTTNPWGPNDPTVGFRGAGTPGGLLMETPAAIERNLRSFVNAKRVQITGASLSFPLNALTGLFVGPESPLFYTYTTLRSEVAYFRDTPVTKGFHDLDPVTAVQTRATC